jgi:hypothetical protein
MRRGIDLRLAFDGVLKKECSYHRQKKAVTPKRKNKAGLAKD